MPNYDYFCPDCNVQLECFSSIKERHNQRCPKCGMPLRKQISVGNVHIFKPYLDTFMSDPPVHIETARQKKQELEKRGLQPKC